MVRLIVGACVFFGAMAAVRLAPQAVHRYMSAPLPAAGAGEERIESIIGLPAGATEVQRVLSDLGAAAPEQMPGVDGDYYQIYKSSGISFRVRDDRIDTVFLYPGGNDGYARFRSRLPRGLTFDDDRGSARRKFGLPDCAGEDVAERAARLGITADSWDRWRADWGGLHATYLPGGRVGLVTLMSSSVQPECPKK